MFYHLLYISECIMPLNTNAEIEKQPLLFIGNYGVYNLAIPKIKDGKLSVFVENSDKIKLACSPAGNSINIYQHIYEGSCKTGRITWLNEEKKEVSEKRVFEAKCLNAHQFALRHTRQQCNNAKGEIYEVGILVSGIFAIFSSCHELNIINLHDLFFLVQAWKSKENILQKFIGEKRKQFNTHKFHFNSRVKLSTDRVHFSGFTNMVHHGYNMLQQKHYHCHIHKTRTIWPIDRVSTENHS